MLFAFVSKQFCFPKMTLKLGSARLLNGHAALVRDHIGKQFRVLEIDKMRVKVQRLLEMPVKQQEDMILQSLPADLRDDLVIDIVGEPTEYNDHKKILQLHLNVVDPIKPKVLCSPQNYLDSACWHYKEGNAARAADDAWKAASRQLKNFMLCHNFDCNSHSKTNVICVRLSSFIKVKTEQKSFKADWNLLQATHSFFHDDYVNFPLELIEGRLEASKEFCNFIFELHDKKCLDNRETLFKKLDPNVLIQLKIPFINGVVDDNVDPEDYERIIVLVELGKLTKKKVIEWMDPVKFAELKAGWFDKQLAKARKDIMKSVEEHDI